MKIHELHALVEAVCPIHGINSNGEIWFKDEATTEQRAAARDVMTTNLPYLEA